MTKTSKKKLEFLFAEIAKSITSSLNHTKIISSIMEEIATLYNPDNWSLLILDPETKELYFEVAKGMDKNLSKKIHLKLGEGIAGHVAQTGQTLYVPNVTKDWRFTDKIDKLSHFVTKSVIAVPIIHQSKVLGVIELINVDVEDFDSQDIATLKTIADFCAIALANANSYENASKLVELDPLTNTYNRNYIDTFMHNKIQEHAKNPSLRFLIAAWVNIDNFSTINDKLGADVGDTILKKTAGVLRQCNAATNTIFRMGSDEFLILLIDLAENDLKKLAEKLKQELHYYSSEISPAKSFSFGLASGLENDFKKVIAEAEKFTKK